MPRKQKYEFCPLLDTVARLKPANEQEALTFTLHDLLKGARAAALVSPESFGRALAAVESHIAVYRRTEKAKAKQAEVAAQAAETERRCREHAHSLPPPACPDCGQPREWVVIGTFFTNGPRLEAHCKACGNVGLFDVWADTRSVSADGVPEKKPCGCTHDYACPQCMSRIAAKANATPAKAVAREVRNARRRIAGDTSAPPAQDPAHGSPEVVAALRGAERRAAAIAPLLSDEETKDELLTLDTARACWEKSRNGWARNFPVRDALPEPLEATVAVEQQYAQSVLPIGTRLFLFLHDKDRPDAPYYLAIVREGRRKGHDILINAGEVALVTPQEEAAAHA